MKSTKLGISRDGLPTLLIFATVDSLLHLLILPEIQPLSRMDFRANRGLEVFIRDLSILIDVKLVEQVLELLICHL
jgi:hypothetical protein